MRASSLLRCIRCNEDGTKCARLFAWCKTPAAPELQGPRVKALGTIFGASGNERWFRLLFFPSTLVVTLINSQLNTAGFIGFPCVFKCLFGFECYGCGMSRAIMALWQGHFTQSYHYNRLGSLVFLLLAWLCIKELYFLTTTKKEPENG